MSRVLNLSAPFLLGFDEIERTMDRLAKGEAGSNKGRSPPLALTTGWWQSAGVGSALVRAARTAVCQCQAL